MADDTMNFILTKNDDWNAVAQAVARELEPGMILGLSGPLGAGKTTFVQYLAEELGAKSRPKSPTFTLVREYPLEEKYSMIKRLIHVDAYRIDHPEDLLPLNLDEELAVPGTIVAIEWPENAALWIERRNDRYREVKILVNEDQSREVNFAE